MSERQLMNRLVRVLGERRRSCLPDESSSIACFGLLGWMRMMYLRPDRLEQATRGWMWLGGLLEAVSKTPRLEQGARPFGAGDQRAIDAYAAAVARCVLRVNDPDQVEWSQASQADEWLPQEIELLVAMGMRHGEVMRRMLVGVLANLDARREYGLPMSAWENTAAPDDKPAGAESEKWPDSGIGALLKELRVGDTVFFRGA